MDSPAPGPENARAPRAVEYNEVMPALAALAVAALLSAPGPETPSPAPPTAPRRAAADAPSPSPGRGPPAAPPPAAPDSPAAEARALAARVQRYYESTRDLRADFVQTYAYAAAGRRQVSTGTLLVKRPGRMRWDYATPSPKTVSVVGARLVQYEPEPNQVYVDERFDSTAMSAAITFLLGKGSLEKEFALSAGEGGTLVLVPRKPDPRVESVTLAVGPEGEVTRTRVLDGQGNVNDLKFRSLRRNAGVREADFEVDVPADAHRVQMPGR
jgi:outer membrane lipoprotein carrier protein